MVRCEATRERRKQRDVTYTIDPEDQSAFCDVNVAWNERVVRRPGRQWGHSHVFSRQEPNPGIVANSVAFALQSTLSILSGAVFAHEEKIRRSGHARGKGT